MADNVLAAPAITSTSGTFAQGQSVTISGSGFGSKSAAAPMVWDNFESGNVGSGLDVPWTFYDNSSPGNSTYDPVITNVKAYGQGNKSLYHRLIADESAWTNYGIVGINSLILYYSVRWRWELNSGTIDTNPIVKLLRINATTSGGDDCMYDSTNCRPHFSDTVRTDASDWSGQVDVLSFGVAETGEIGFDHTSDPANTEANRNIWHRSEMYWVLSNPAGTANGTFKSWLDSDPNMNYTNYVTRESGYSSRLINSVMIPAMIDNPGSASYDFWVDDVYVDTTPQRVEICGGSVWADRGNCEIQIPHTSWNASQLQITINQGSFVDSSNQYLFVVDSAGTANADGYQITFGSGVSDTIPPANPTGLAVS